MCGEQSACADDSDSCKDGKCKCGDNDQCAAPLSNICDTKECKCGGNDACKSGTTLDTCLKAGAAATKTDTDAACGVSFIIMFCIQ